MRMSLKYALGVSLCLVVGVISPIHVALAHSSDHVTDVEEAVQPHDHAHGHGHHHHHGHSHKPTPDGDKPDSESSDSSEGPDHSHSVYDHAGLVFSKSKQSQDAFASSVIVTFDDTHQTKSDTWHARSDESPPDSSPPLPANPRGPPAAS